MPHLSITSKQHRINLFCCQTQSTPAKSRVAEEPNWKQHTRLQTRRTPQDALTFPPSALYSFSSASSSLAKPKSVILMWLGDLTSTFLAARSRCTSLRSSRYIMPCEDEGHTENCQIQLKLQEIVKDPKIHGEPLNLQLNPPLSSTQEFRVMWHE